ncbi:MAG: hypothetical protein AB1633_03980 [Elusimicrobiota bacterium]
MKNVTNLEQETYGAYSYLTYKLGYKFNLTLFNEWSQFRFNKNAEARQTGCALSFHPSALQRVRLQVNQINQQHWKNAVSKAIGIPAGDGEYLQISLQWNIWMGTHIHDFD